MFTAFYSANQWHSILVQESDKGLGPIIGGLLFKVPKAQRQNAKGRSIERDGKWEVVTPPQPTKGSRGTS